jgi:hypothetical protein
MKTLIILSLLLFLANCSVHSVKIGKKCTTAGDDGSFEKSFIWFVDKDTVTTFDKKINKSNCKKNT